MSKKAATVSKKAPSVTIVSLEQHRSEKDRSIWVAELLSETERVGADNRFGSWTCFERVAVDESLTLDPTTLGSSRWEVQGEVAQMLQTEVALRLGRTGESVPVRTRRRK